MFLKTLMMAGLILACVTPASATSTERQVVIEHYLSEAAFTSMHGSLAKRYVRTITEDLGANSVYIEDDGIFADMLPLSLTDGARAKMRAHLIETCFDTMSPREVAVAAAHVAQGDPASEHYSGDDLERVQLRLGACIFGASLRWVNAPERKRAELPVAYHADVARILETPGVARFPNRVIRQSVISEYQRAAQ